MHSFPRTFFIVSTPFFMESFDSSAEVTAGAEGCNLAKCSRRLLVVDPLFFNFFSHNLQRTRSPPSTLSKLSHTELTLSAAILYEQYRSQISSSSTKEGIRLAEPEKCPNAYSIRVHGRRSMHKYSCAAAHVTQQIWPHCTYICRPTCSIATM